MLSVCKNTHNTESNQNQNQVPCKLFILHIYTMHTSPPRKPTDLTIQTVSAPKHMGLVSLFGIGVDAYYIYEKLLSGEIGISERSLDHRLLERLSRVRNLGCDKLNTVTF
ncbi:unnamed protein product [Cochlearia groenlandica]